MAKTSANVLLDPLAIQKAESLGLHARFIVEGYMAGEHKSPFRGFAIEFTQHREYVPGDDTRHLDWKVLGRTDRYFLKQYEQETNYVAHLLLDGSESMKYGSGIKGAASGTRKDGRLLHAMDPYVATDPVACSLEFDGLEQIPKVMTPPRDVRKRYPRVV